MRSEGFQFNRSNRSVFEQDAELVLRLKLCHNMLTVAAIKPAVRSKKDKFCSSVPYRLKL